MLVSIGHVEGIFRYPVKSMAGQALETAQLGRHGIGGDRRLALRRRDDRHSGFPWLTAGKLADLLLYAPHVPDGEELPAHVRTPGGNELPVFGDELAGEVTRRLGAPVEMQLQKHGIFDDAALSVITTATVDELGRLSGQPADARRFRPNLLVRRHDSVAFAEDEWVGGVISFGEGSTAPAVAVTSNDVRCSMVNLDPDTALSAPEVLKAVVRANGNNAGVYGAVLREGRITVGQRLFFRAVLDES
jgi:uncharacterized protein YcbX